MRRPDRDGQVGVSRIVDGEIEARRNGALLLALDEAISRVPRGHDDHDIDDGDASDPRPVADMAPANVDVQRIERAVREILLAVGEDPDREGLLKTPNRVARAYGELMAGLADDPKRHLKTVFHEQYDEVVLLRDISFHSLCEHHLLPFSGRAHVAYLPTDRVVGISKLARVVRGYARRLQIQEKMTSEIANAIQDVLRPHGVGVVIEAEHSCMTMRGVDVPGASLTTSCLLGAVREDPRTREEFLRLVRG